MANALFAIEKTPEQAAADRRDRVARVNGFLRQPNYLRSYAKASGMLLSAARDEDCYDDVGLPLFYLQRHAVELAIKAVLELLIDIEAMQRILLLPADADWQSVAEEEARRHSSEASGHCLARLVDSAECLLGRKPAHERLPAEFRELVSIIERVENDEKGRSRPDRVRYPYMMPKGGELRHEARSIPSSIVLDADGHFVERAPDTVLPIGLLHDKLKSLLEGPMRCRSYEDGTFLSELAVEHEALSSSLLAQGRW